MAASGDIEAPLLGDAGSDGVRDAKTPGNEDRTIYVNDPGRTASLRGDTPFVDNVVITSHYTATNFVPKFLVEQFSRFANAYFLAVSVLQCIPAVSITAGVPTALVPLSFVILFDAIVTAREDYRRHVDDDADNGHPTLALRNGTFVEVKWRDVVVGDVLKVMRGEVFPADLVFLSAHTSDGTAPEACYVQTAQLDGETNLKLKKAVAETAEHFESTKDCADFRGIIQAEPPNGLFGKFTATVQMEPGAVPVPLEADQLLLRGCVLRNVEYIYGVVAYTGKETKVRVKQKEIKVKRASLEVFINRCILALVAMLLACCILGVIMYAIYIGTLADTAWYLHYTSTPSAGDIVGKIFTFFLLNSSFIPVSLYVSMKFARTAQKYFMEKDIKMYHEEPELVESSGDKEGAYPLKVRTMDLNDELGQISHIFSDKTGTFTLNYMEFRKLTIDGVSYGLGATEIGLDRMKREGQDTSEIEAIMAAAAERPRVQPHVNFEDGSDSHRGRSIQSDLANHEEGPGGRISTAKTLELFFLHLTLNHTVVVETLLDSRGNPKGSQLSASSPDEEAFVYAGRFFGFDFRDREADEVILNVALPGSDARERRFLVLHVLAYNQQRKRMSVIVQEILPESEDEAPVYLFCKGADTAIMARLAEIEEGSHESAVLNSTNEHLTSWGNDGLRTLVFGYKELDHETYDRWNEEYNKARGSFEELSKRKNGEDNDIDRLMEEAESGLTLQGATANEDKLQPAVPETIANLARAGISIWMLTGDKQETAVNIGYATKMLTNDMEHHVCTVDSAGSAKAAMEQLYAIDPFSKPRDADWALVIDERTLDVATATDRGRQQLLAVSRTCKAVICCRARPDQKAAMVTLIREGVPGTKTLAIGDGANDVDMIQTAHVGVGIVGAEGVQAANAADFSIGRFRFLERLLLVHGRWNYRRMAKLVCYMFYKNICMVLCQYLFTADAAAWSGQKFFIEYAVQTFNLIYTGPAVLLLGTLDQDVSDKNALRYPQLYGSGPAGAKLNNGVFWGNWVISAIVDAMFIYFFVWFANQWGDAETGDSPSVFELGVICFTAVVCVTNVRVAIETHCHYPFFQFVVIMSVLAWWPMAYIFDLLNANDMRGGMSRVFGNGATWLACILVTVIAFLRPLWAKVWRRWFTPELSHCVQEVQLCFGAEGSANSTAALRRLDSKVSAPVQRPARRGNRSGTVSSTAFDLDIAHSDHMGEIATRSRRSGTMSRSKSGERGHTTLAGVAMGLRASQRMLRYSRGAEERKAE